jgi:3-oxoadipate enol-lactonase
LKTIDFPTMIIVGQEDEFTPLPVAKYMHDRISDSVLRSINNAGHMPNMEQPDEFNHLIAELLVQISAKSSK